MNEHQQFEQQWWGDCCNTFSEEQKQVEYAKRMGLEAQAVDGKWPVYDLGGRSVVDLGGGPVSLLLKSVNRGESCVVVDPCEYPSWVTARYAHLGISQLCVSAETFEDYDADEVWIYNVLQHVGDPEAVIRTAQKCAPLLRIFEWVEHPASIGHPHVLHVHELNEWIGNGANGNVELLEEGDLHGIAYSGVFALEPVAV